jgi:hypothetical protein
MLACCWWLGVAGAVEREVAQRGELGIRSNQDEFVGV